MRLPVSIRHSRWRQHAGAFTATTKDNLMSNGRRRRRVLPNGRDATRGPFVMLNHYVFDCAAFRTMAAGPRALLWELIRRYNGSNNGRIGLGVRDAAIALNVSKDTAASYFKVLIAHGFIAASRLGGFNMKDPNTRRASEWRLTNERCNDQPPTKEFIDVSRQLTVRSVETPSPRMSDEPRERLEERPGSSDLVAPTATPRRPTRSDTYRSGHGPAAKKRG